MNTAVRILSALGSIWAYLAFRTNIRKENQRRALQQRLDQVIRGAR